MTRNGDDMQVKIFEDSLCISSPGQLPFDMPMEFLMKPTHPSRPRNKIIAQAFFDMGIIERYGSGIKRIKGDCDKNGNPYPEWGDRHGEFATTYWPRASSDKSNIGLGGNDGNLGGNGGNRAEERRVNMQSANDALKTALKSLGKNEDDEIVAKILSVFTEIADNPSTTLSAIAQTLGLSERAVDEYVSILKGIGVLRRKDGRKFGTWEILA